MFYNTLLSSTPEVIELDEEPEEDNLGPLSNENDVASVRGKGKGMKVVPHASSQVSICSFTKAYAQRTVAPVTTVVGSLTATSSPLPPTMLPLLPIAAQPSHGCLARRRLFH